MEANKRDMPHTDCTCILCAVENVLPETITESHMSILITRIFWAYKIAPRNAITTAYTSARDYEHHYLTNMEVDGDDEQEEDDQNEPNNNGRTH